ncbi:MAG: phosphotransferase enzyme family protein [Bacillota bacterium]
MKLSFMNQVIQTVDGEGHSPLAERLLPPWGFERGTAKFFRASANCLFTFRRQGQQCFLRFNHLGERDKDFVEDELKLLQELVAQGVSVARPIPSSGGNLVEVQETVVGPVLVVVFEALEGEQRELDEMTEDQVEQWGAALGRLHRVMKTMPADRWPNRPSWPDLLRLAKSQVAPGEAHLLKEIDEVAELLAALPADSERAGLIHFDFEADNLVWNDAEVAALDFDDSARLWYVADIIFALRDLFSGRAPDTGDPTFQRFLKGYRSETGLDDAMMAHLSLFVRLHRLFFIGRLRRAVDLTGDADYPEWVLKLGAKLRGRIDSYCADIRDGAVIVR